MQPLDTVRGIHRTGRKRASNVTRLPLAFFSLVQRVALTRPYRPQPIGEPFGEGWLQPRAGDISWSTAYLEADLRHQNGRLRDTCQICFPRRSALLTLDHGLIPFHGFR